MSTGFTEGSNILLALSNSLAGAIAQVESAIVAVHARQRRSSSGVHWRSGIIVAADHTIRREEEISVTLPNGKTVPATLTGRDAGTDLAILQINAGDLPTVQVSQIPLQVGTLVMAVGRSDENGTSASMGVISALSGSWRSWHGGRIDQFIRPDVTLYPGCSGGVLIDAEGKVIGINTSGPRHMPLTIPASTIDRVINQILQTGQVSRGYLGVGMQTVRLPGSMVNALNLSGDGGVIVVSVEPDSPADRAGILLGDVLVSLGDSPVQDYRDVQAKLDPEQVGKPLGVRVIRGGTLVDLTVVVGERPRRG